MDDISVGDYVRTKDGIIGKVFEEDDIGDKGVCIDNSFFIIVYTALLVVLERSVSNGRRMERYKTDTRDIIKLVI